MNDINALINSLKIECIEVQEKIIKYFSNEKRKDYCIESFWKNAKKALEKNLLNQIAEIATRKLYNNYKLEIKRGHICYFRREVEGFEDFGQLEVHFLLGDWEPRQKKALKKLINEEEFSERRPNVFSKESLDEQFSGRTVEPSDEITLYPNLRKLILEGTGPYQKLIITKPKNVEKPSNIYQQWYCWIHNNEKEPKKLILKIKEKTKKYKYSSEEKKTLRKKMNYFLFLPTAGYFCHEGPRCIGVCYLELKIYQGDNVVFTKNINGFLQDQLEQSIEKPFKILASLVATPLLIAYDKVIEFENNRKDLKDVFNLKILQNNKDTLIVGPEFGIAEKVILNFIDSVNLAEMPKDKLALKLMELLWRRAYEGKLQSSIFINFNEAERLLFWLKEYRDHLIHSANVYLLGMALLAKLLGNEEKDEIRNFLKAEKLINNDNDYNHLPFSWAAAASYHDFSMPIQKLNEVTEKIFSIFANLEEFRLDIDSEFVQKYVSHNITIFYFQLLRSAQEGGCTEVSQLENKIKGNISQWPLLVSKETLKLIVQNCDHGVVSTIAFLSSCFMGGKKKKKTIQYEPEELKAVFMAAEAMMLHNLIFQIKDGQFEPFYLKYPPQLRFKDNPIAFLLALCDKLQDWGREGNEKRPSANVKNIDWGKGDEQNILKITCKYDWNAKDGICKKVEGTPICENGINCPNEKLCKDSSKDCREHWERVVNNKLDFSLIDPLKIKISFDTPKQETFTIPK